MHPNPAFRGTARDINICFARDRSFGVLAASAEGAPLLSHVPFLLSEDGTSADLHLVRSNPITRALRSGPMQARIAVSGPEGYISPDWYGIADQVPTWNYVAVHLTGLLELRPDAELRDLLARQSAWFEARLAPKPEWTLDKMSEDALAKMLRQIVPVRLQVAEIDGTWKLNQNKPDAVREAAAEAVAEQGAEQGTATLAALMRGAG